MPSTISLATRFNTMFIGLPARTAPRGILLSEQMEVYQLILIPAHATMVLFNVYSVKKNKHAGLYSNHALGGPR